MEHLNRKLKKHRNHFELIDFRHINHSQFDYLNI